MVLLHTFIFYHFSIKKNNKENYFKYLNFLIIPLLFITILIHEYQVFALSLHFLISLGAIKEKKEIRKIIKSYLTLILPIILILFFFGNQIQFDNLSEILRKFNVELNFIWGRNSHYIGAFINGIFFIFLIETL